MCGSRKAEQLSPESRLSHKLNARLTVVNGTSEKLLLFGCSTLYSTPHIPLSVAPYGNHSPTQPLSTSSALAQVSVLAPEFVNPSALCFFVEILWATVQVSLFSFLRERERERETGVGGREVCQMDRAARKNFF